MRNIAYLIILGFKALDVGLPTCLPIKQCIAKLVYKIVSGHDT
ncbi:hypothetical protein VCRA2126O85_410019 [Vibrio crassostreae]|nr:hypothetical protein VCRA2128O106_400025 [Vibrio crassostreae]CAK2947592.1 hypothetical protein VCRA2125O83_400020 [Vibrio crassostreae]CAK2948954.1 hypothetical protein VCRA2128O100_420026 [Vibrio crassostreae]CAK2948958.1 hypothetical protein VCRA2126O86_410019 [Vibrio crassostreae]CAK2950901.1 hypothetical protein VCRA2127O91_410019 [Vibrio crassostreae]